MFRAGGRLSGVKEDGADRKLTQEQERPGRLTGHKGRSTSSENK
jgi:hypothetical protein